MYFMWIFVITLVGAETLDVNVTDCPNVKTALGSYRKRRHLSFPDGSHVVLTLSVVKTIVVHVPSGWNLAMEVDVMYDLPDSKFRAAFLRKKLHHRQKREFWERVREALELHNLNGRACVLKSICEARVGLAKPGVSLVHDLLRAVFTAPTHEENFAEELGGTYEELFDPHFCDKDIDCPFSLLHFVLAMNKQK